MSNPFKEINKIKERIIKHEKKLDNLEKEINKHFSDGNITKQQMKSLKEDVNKLRFEDKKLIENIEETIGVKNG